MSPPGDTVAFRPTELSEMNSNRNGNTRAVHGLPRLVDADIVDLGANGKGWSDWQVHSPAETKSQVGAGSGGTKSGSSAVDTSDHALHERIDPRRILQHQARTEEK